MPERLVGFKAILLGFWELDPLTTREPLISRRTGMFEAFLKLLQCLIGSMGGDTGSGGMAGCFNQCEPDVKKAVERVEADKPKIEG